jgi:hypothetical protein
MGHTIDDTSGSSGFGFSIKSYIAMITKRQLFVPFFPPFHLSPLLHVNFEMKVKKRCDD